MSPVYSQRLQLNSSGKVNHNDRGMLCHGAIAQNSTDYATLAVALTARMRRRGDERRLSITAKRAREALFDSRAAVGAWEDFLLATAGRGEGRDEKLKEVTSQVARSAWDRWRWQEPDDAEREAAVKARKRAREEGECGW